MKKKCFENTAAKVLLLLFIISAAISFQSCISSGKSDIQTDDPEEAFRIAKKNYDAKDYLDAIDDFSYIKVRFSGTKIIDQAQYYFAMCYFQREEYILAAYEFDYLLKNYPTSEYVPRARYNIAMCYYKLSPKYNLDQTYSLYAISEFITYLELYPNDINAREAEKKIIELRNKLAYKDLQSGILYYKMDDYKASIVYFESVLETYFDSEYADDALLWKIDALFKRKKYEEAKKEIERFEKKFPSSELLRKVSDFKNSLPSVP